MENNNVQPQQATQPQAPQYQAPIDQTSQVMSIGQYIGMFVLSAIPVVNIICWIVWLCSSDTNKNKKNYIIASIILWAICFAISIIVYAIFGAAAATLLS